MSASRRPGRRQRRASTEFCSGLFHGLLLMFLMLQVPFDGSRQHFFQYAVSASLTDRPNLLSHLLD